MVCRLKANVGGGGVRELAVGEKIVKPWYIWLSIFTFIFMWVDTARRIKLTKKLEVDFDAQGLWLKALGNFFWLWGFFIMIPVVLFSQLQSFADTSFGSIWSNIISISILICMYLLGVFIAYKHLAWREKNISHLLKNSDKKV